MVKTITLLNEKGGVGKTSLATNIACGLAAQGGKVILIDGDPQGHATVRCGIHKSAGLYDLLVRDADWRSVLRVMPPERHGIPGHPLPSGRVWVVPSNVETRNIANSMSEAERLAIRLEELDGQVDFVIIDSSPTPSLLHGVFYTATDAIIYPTELAFTAFDGLVESIKRRMAADEARRSRWSLPPIKVLGIQPTKYRSNTAEQKENLAELKKQFSDLVWEPIPLRTIWPESEGRALPVFNLDPRSEAAADVWRICKNVEEGIYV